MNLPKTKIVCTLGPSSWNPEVLRELIGNGMTVARVNGAFADVPEMQKIQDAVRSISNSVALMIDIKGHEVRLNKFENDVEVKPGDSVVIGSDDRDYMYTITYPDLYKNLKMGDTFLIDDGNTILTVQKVEDRRIYANVIVGSKIPKGKSINLPGIFLDNPPITERDIAQIKFAVENKWDFVAASFIRSKEDVLAVKEHVLGSHTKIISKIEDKFGIDNIDEIIEVSEGIMVARGDMGVEIPYYKVPSVQRDIIKKCNHSVKPVIVATQMLESMIKLPRPTRAEVSDVANAVYEGADAVMLSGETTTGAYPLECVKVMKEIAIETEKNMYAADGTHDVHTHFKYNKIDDGTEVAIAIAQSVANLSHKIPDAKIIVDTRTGFSARLVASFDLQSSIFAITPFDYYARRLALSKGIIPYKRKEDISSLKNMSEVKEFLLQEAKDYGFIKKGDNVILVMSASYNLLPEQDSHEKASIKILSV